MAWNNTAVTTAGNALLQRVLVGEILSLDYAAGGSLTADAASLMVQTDLRDQKQRFEIVGTSKVTNGQKINIQVLNKGLKAEYTMKQIGIWAHIGDDSPVLFALLQDEKGIDIPSEADVVDFALNFYAVIDFNGQGEFSITVEPSALVTTAVLLEKLSEKADKEHLHDGRYYTVEKVDKLFLSKSDVLHTHFKRLLTAEEDMNSITEDGVYVYSTSSVPKNAPFSNAAVVEVFGAPSDNAQKIQRAYRYGAPGYSAFRPLYSGTWSTWNYPLVTADSSNLAVTDYVVEQGISGKWTYRKWASGVAECWGTVTLTLSKDAYVWYGDIYCASGYGGSVLTSVFTSYTCVSIDPIYWYQIGGSGRVTAGGTLEANIFGKSTSMSSLKKDGQVDMNCIVKGRWK